MELYNFYSSHLLLFLCISTISTYSFTKRVCFNTTKGECEEEAPEPEFPIHLPNECCHCRVSSINKVNEVKVQDDNNNKEIPICLKCAICLSIADNIRALFDAVVNKLIEEECQSPENERNIVSDSLQNLCLKGFKSYDLRSFKGYTVVTQISSFTDHVRSNFDGLWTSKLRKSCNRLIQYLDKYDLYNSYKSNTINVTEYLCTSGGAFRECNNVPFETVELPGKSDFSLGFWVKCNLE